VASRDTARHKTYFSCEQTLKLSFVFHAGSAGELAFVGSFLVVTQKKQIRFCKQTSFFHICYAFVDCQNGAEQVVKMLKKEYFLNL
jgi:hypothetical protein